MFGRCLKSLRSVPGRDAEGSETGRELRGMGKLARVDCSSYTQAERRGKIPLAIVLLSEYECGGHIEKAPRALYRRPGFRGSCRPDIAKLGSPRNRGVVHIFVPRAGHRIFRDMG